MDARILLDHEKAADGNSHVVRALLRVEGDAPAADDRVPLNLSLVLDRSGSMMGRKLDRAREAAALLVRRLWPEDRVSVVAYGSEVETVAEPATGEGQADLTRRIGEIVCHGCTNLSGGWLRGRELVAAAGRDGGVNRVILLTDGLANVGITDAERLTGLCRKALDDGLSTTTIGFGAGYDDLLLQGMAEAGGGGAYHIERPDQAPAIFEEEIDGLLSLGAQNLSVELRPAGGARLSLVHHLYPSRDIEGGVRLQLGDLYAREPRLVLAEFLVPADDPAEAVAVAEFTVTADVLTEDGGIERRVVYLPIRASLADGPHSEPEVRRELLLQGAARAREDARNAQDRGDFDAAAGRLGDAADRLAAYGADDAELAEEAEDLRRMAGRFRQGLADAADAKYMTARSLAGRWNRRAYANKISRSKRDVPESDEFPRRDEFPRQKD